MAGFRLPVRGRLLEICPSDGVRGGVWCVDSLDPIHVPWVSCLETVTLHVQRGRLMEAMRGIDGVVDARYADRA